MNCFGLIRGNSVGALRRRILIGLAMAVGPAWADGGHAAERFVLTNTAALSADPGATREAGARIDALIRAANAGEPTASLAYGAAELGMTALWLAADRMDPDKPSHRTPLLLLAEQAATVRRTQRELLRLYDPAAFMAFYTEEGVRLQSWLAAALKWEPAPPNMPRAMVLAAPDPTLNWLEAQDTQKQKPGKLLIELLRQWGSLAAIGREPQYLPRLRSLARRLAESPTIRADEDAMRTILQLIGDVDCRDAAAFAISALDHPEAAIRSAAAATLRRLGGDDELQALTDHASKETDPAVQAAIANALGRWPSAPEAGDACLRLYGRTVNADVRRAVLNAAATSDWPARESLVRRALEAGEGAALLALAAKPMPGLDDALLSRLKNAEGQILDPVLLDAVALARISNAVPTIVHYLQQEQNIAMRLKYIAALEMIGGNGAGSAILRLLDGHRDELEVEYAVSSLGRLGYVPAVTRLARIAKQEGMEIGIRVQAIWALGRMQDELAKKELEAIRQLQIRPPAAPGSQSADLAYHARLVKPHLLLARFRADPSAVSDELGRMFAEAGPIERTTLLGGLAEQGRDHPIIAAGFESLDFSVRFMAIAAAKAANPATYGPRVRRLAASPYIQALADISLETWDLRGLLSEGWR